MKRNKKLILLTLLVLLCIALLATGTYAAFIKLVSVKRVVIAKGTGSELCFSSNYLEETVKTTPTYAEKIITASDSRFTINLDIYNFPKSDGTKFSQVDITYELSISLIPNDNTYEEITISNDVNDWLTLETSSSSSVIGTHTIKTGSVKTDSYTISCNDNAKLKLLQNYKIRITATPQNVYQEKMLAADFKLVFTSQSTHWQGRLIDIENGYTLAELDAFNYEIYGTAQESVTLTWPEEKVALSPWSKRDLGIDETGNTGTATFSVGGDGKPSSYLLQFYKVSDNIDELTINLSPNS